jgi:hypothetical protein
VPRSAAASRRTSSSDFFGSIASAALLRHDLL